MPELKYYALQVVKLEDSARRPNNAPIYVQVKIDKTVHKTGHIDADGKPSWASTITFSDLHTDATFNIRLKQRRKGARGRQVGSVDVTAQGLYDKGDVRLNLIPATAGAVHIRLKTVDAFGRAEAELANAEQSVGQIRTPRSEFTLGTIGSVINALDGLVTAVDAVAELHSLFDVSWKATSALYKLISHQFKTDAQLQVMVKTMADACNFSEKAKKLKDRTEELNVIIKELLNESVECCQFVRKYASRSFVGRMARWQESQRIADYAGRFNDLRERLEKVIALNTAKGVDAIEAHLVSQKVLDALIDPSRMDASVSRVSKRARCLNGTRKEYLDNISTRLLSDESRNTVWLTGAAGSGKSTIALTILDHCDKMNCPPAYVFFERGKDECDSVIRAIACRLATLHETLRQPIVDALAQNHNINGKSLEVQFEKLMLEPLRTVADKLDRRIIIILDALDESGSGEQRKELVRLLKNDFGKLPSKVRVLVTSRPENDIVEGISSARHIYHVALEHKSEGSRNDVASYLQKEMKEVVEKRAPKGKAWDDAVQRLSDAADGVFIWASTAVKMVGESHQPWKELERLLNNLPSVGGGIDNLYLSVLEQSGISWKGPDSRVEFARILGVILFAKEAMSDVGIEAFLGMEEGTADSILSHLRSVLSYEAGQPVRIHHASFADYLVERCRSKPWSVDEADLKKTITERCFDVMKEELRFNICDFPSSFVKNDDVPGLAEKVKNRIRPHLDYACRFWSVHLCELDDTAIPLDKVDTFVHKHLLYWLEVLSLKKYFNRVAGTALRDACIRIASIHTEISSFLWATYRLVVIFADPILQSAPHIYLSAISLWKGESRIADHYSKTHPLLCVQRFGKKAPAMCMKVLEGHTSLVMSVVFSPDGKCIASGSDDGTIRIWDADSGELVSRPLEGHTDAVLSVAFSPDGKRIASGSVDNTVRVWDVNSGQLVAGPFEGHTNEVNAVAFSPDGRCIVSGSIDTTIRIWDSVTGKLVLEPLEGHTGVVYSVAFSPDGKRVVSGSSDGTVRIWDADSGQLVATLEGHTDEVKSVAFSPDGKRVVSGSDDKTIRIWDVESGQQLLGFEGHKEGAWSVAFSHDGKSIASGSADSTICIWDANSGSLVSGPFRGHTFGVNSVAFSPDGKRVVSASDDRTVRIWDADRGKIDSGSFEGHTDWIASVAFHPDGRRVVSGSYDGTICIWDVESGQLVSGPLRGHSNAVFSVVISLDGQRIASGAGDKTVCVWDTETGNAVCGPIEGHIGAVCSVAFSPDNERIVSCSIDGTIRIWDAVSGKLVLEPLEGHTDVVWFVAFSPVGKRVASGSSDNTIRIWDADTGELLSGPLEGHTFVVTSVAFSLDGRRIVSGSADKTVRIWNAHTGKLILGPLEGHTDWVRSVAFSPDGKHIVSGSDDKTIRIWCAATGRLLLEQFEGHTHFVRSVGFSPDGEYVVSGSDDRSIRIWQINDDEDSTVLVEKSTSSSERTLTCPNLVTRGMDKRRTNSDWKMGEDGWVLGTGGELLAWIPEDMRGTLWRYRNTAIFNAQFSTKLDFVNSTLGEDWCKGFPKSS